MLKSALFVMTTSYFAWYFEHHELSAVYPFDSTYVSPSSAGEPRLAETFFETEDGERLIMWRAEATTGKPTVLYFSGNAGGLKGRSDRFRDLINQGYGIIAPAYRGSSGSTGKPTETALVADARAIAAAANTGELVIYGESLGSAVAIRLAAEGIGAKLVLEAPFTSIPDLVLAQHPTEQLDHLITQRWNSRQHADGITQPLLIVHGESDRQVPIAMGEAIFGLAASKEKRMFKVMDAGHARLWTPEVRMVVFDFLDD